MITTHLVLFSFFNGAGGTPVPPVPPVIGPPSGGKGDNDRYAIYKPSGLLDRPARKKITKAIAKVQQRVDETDQIAREVAAKAKEEFFGPEQIEALLPKETMSAAQVDAEIGRLLHMRIRTEEDETLLLFLIVAAASA